MIHFPEIIRYQGGREFTKSVIVSFCALIQILSALAGDAPAARCDPDWADVTWETRYDGAKLARVRLHPKSLLPGQLAVIKTQEVTFTPSGGEGVPLEGGWIYGGYVFDSWDELLKLLENSVGGISIQQPAFTQNSNHQIFALSADQQNALHFKKGVLGLKVTLDVHAPLESQVFPGRPNTRSKRRHSL